MFQCECIEMLERVWRKRNLLTLLMGMEIGIATMEDSMLLLLSHFSRVRPSATPWTAAFQARVLEWGAIAFSRGQYGGS